MKITIILISKAGLSVAQLIRQEILEAEIVTTSDVEGCTRIISYDQFLAEEFMGGNAFIFIGAMGICVRLIAPYIKDKYKDPAVVCVDSTGRYVIPVLSGHIGKANELAEQVSHILGAEAVVTTQSDRIGLWPLDLLGERYGWTTIPYYKDATDKHEAMNRLIALFVQQVPTLLCIEADVPGTDELKRTAPAHVTVRCGIPKESELNDFRLVIRVTPFLHEADKLPTLTYVPKVWYIGIGLAHQASPAGEIIKALNDTLIQARLNPTAIKEMSTIDIKQDEPVVKTLKAQGIPFRFFTADELNAVNVPTPSEKVAKHVGTPSVAEASALLSASAEELILKKRKGSNYTMAVATERGILHLAGHIEIVGAGPGDPELISVRGRQMLERADLILYAGSLVPRELTLCAKPGAVVRSSASMNLEEQFVLMKEYYDRGQFIVRLHTGDPCIYGAIEEQMNYFDQYGMNYHITPGISSFQAAAAELKSQFTIPERVQTIILTRGEGRTPMPEREKLHLLARSQSTMCIFLSASIADKVQAELLEEYSEDTPVAVCYHLTWKDQCIWRGKLKNLAAIVRDNQLSLTTLIVVGEAIDNRKGLSRLYADEFKHLYRK